jgi:hypothetical protein
MSGGSFDYAYSRVAQFADDLELRLHEAHTLYGHEVAEKLAELVIDARALSRQMHAAERLFSGDIGEDTFMARMEE